MGIWATSSSNLLLDTQARRRCSPDDAHPCYLYPSLSWNTATRPIELVAVGPSSDVPPHECDQGSLGSDPPRKSRRPGLRLDCHAMDGLAPRLPGPAWASLV